MPMYSLSAVSNNTAAATPCLDIEAGPVNTARLIEFGLSVANASATSSFGLGRPGNDGSVVQWGAYPFLPDRWDDQASVAISGGASLIGSQTQLGLLWTVAPTVPANYLRRAFLPNTQNAGMIWTFPRGVLMALSRGLVLWNIGVGTTQVATNIIIHE